MLRETTTVPVEVNDEKLKIIQEHAERQGMSVDALLASIVHSYAEWWIPVKSFEPITVPKKMIGALFEMVSRENIDQLTEQWAVEARNIVLLSGSSFSIETAIDFTYKISKYFMGADAKLVKKKPNDRESNNNIISFIIRHDGGEKFSYFCTRCFYYFYSFFPLKHVIVRHDASSVYIDLDLVEDEIETMKHYLELIEGEIKKSKNKPGQDMVAAITETEAENQYRFAETA
jgi:hypothetical protein